MKMRYIIGMLAVIILAGCMQESTVNVQGTYQRDYHPDQATVSVGVSLLNETAENAQNQANKIINNIIDGLHSLGIQDKDIQTQQLSLYEEQSYTANRGTQPVGWRATQTLNVMTANLSMVGPIVDKATQSGANQINSINFGLSQAKDNEYRQEALAGASANAKTKAMAIADSLGEKLGGIKSVTESNFNYVPYTYNLQAALPQQAVSEAATVLPSDVTITATISVVYYLE
jgi:uncharacterized protein YggE